MAAIGGLALAAPSPKPANQAVGIEPGVFRGFIESLWPEVQGHGLSRDVFDAAFAGMTPDASLAALTRRQPEFAKPIGAYLQSQVTPGRIVEARARLAQWREVLDTIEKRFGVPPAIVVAVWGLESNFGGTLGSKDTIRSLATLAAMNYRPDLNRAELLSALALLKDSDVPRANLRGSWAGAMGQPQFMPSSFEKYAVDGDGDGRRDIWTNVPDVLASIANFLHAQGYQPDRPWGFEVRVPSGFDLRISRGSLAEWTSRGLTLADGQAPEGQGEYVLFYPAGAAGPAFLVSANYEVLKTYNFSDAYVLSIATLADRMAGGGPIRASWPGESSMARDKRIALQTRLVALGYPVDNREGRISLALRDMIRAAQAAVGLVPDGNPTDALLAALSAAAPQP